MIRLHHAPGTAAMVPHILLEELGVAYQRVPVDLAANAHRGGRASELPRVGAYLRRMLDRPAVQRVLAQDQLQPPFV